MHPTLRSSHHVGAGGVELVVDALLPAPEVLAVVVRRDVTTAQVALVPVLKSSDEVCRCAARVVVVLPWRLHHGLLLSCGVPYTMVAFVVACSIAGPGDERRRPWKAGRHYLHSVAPECWPSSGDGLESGGDF